MEMCVKIVYLETIKEGNGLSEDIKILMNVDIGIYIVPKNISSILGININDVLRNKKWVKEKSLELNQKIRKTE